MKKITIEQKNFDLKSIRQLPIAEFERKIYNPHLQNIMEAITNKNLLDNVITVYKHDNKIEVIDGQHRIIALRKLMESNKIRNYIIQLRTIRANSLEEAKEIYKSLNKGKQLNVFDLLKTYDNQQLDFFNILRNVCVHYISRSSINPKISYWTALSMIENFKKIDFNHRNRNEIDSMLSRVERTDCIKLMGILKLFYKTMGGNRNNWWYRDVASMSIIRVIWENFPKLNEKLIIKFFNLCKDDNFLMINCYNRSAENQKTVFNYLENLFYDKVLPEKEEDLKTNN